MTTIAELLGDGDDLPVGRAIALDTTASLSFRSSFERRRLAGLVVEWDTPAFARESRGKRFAFRRGSLIWDDIGRVKLNIGHDRGRTVEAAIDARDRPKGLEMTFAVAHTEAGDEALVLAADHALDGFSIEPEIIAGERIEDHDGPVVAVSEARLAGVALTGYPAFPEARLAGVFESDRPPFSSSAAYGAPFPTAYGEDVLRSFTHIPPCDPDPWCPRIGPELMARARTRMVLRTDPVTRTETLVSEPAGPDIALEARMALGRALDGVPIEPPADYSAAERETFAAEVAKLQERH